MRHLALVLFLLLAPPSVHSQHLSVGTITVEDNPALRPSEIRAALRLSEGGPLTAGEASASVLDSLCRERGYYFARSNVRIDRDAADTSIANVRIDIDAGEFLPVVRIGIEGLSALPPDDVGASLETVVGEPLHAAALERDLHLLLERLATVGHPLAAAAVEGIALDSSGGERGLGVVLRVDEGPRIVLTEVRIRGNAETRDDVILRAARIRLGEPYNADEIAEIPGRLNRLNIFSSVGEPQLYRTPEGGSGVLIPVVEGAANSFDGVLGYLPGADGGEGYFSGLVVVAMRNLFGTGRLAGVRWQREDRSSQEIDLRYGEPWLFGYPVSLGVEFFQRQQESTYVHRVLTLSTSVVVSDELTADGHVSFEATIPSSERPVAVVDESRTLLAGLGVGYDTRSNLISPTAGVMFRAGYEFGSKTIQRPGEELRDPVQIVSMDAEAYTMLFPQQVLAVGIHGRERLGAEIGLADYYRLGGARTLRGYRESQFLGSRIGWAALEYRYLLAPRSFVFGFVDAGYYYTPPDDAHGVASSQALKEGYGVGVRTDTPLGSLGISVALGGGDSFGQAKLHVGLISEF